jgi:hypothetical protein
VNIVYIPHGGGGRGPVSDEAGVERVGRVEHYSCGAAGLASAVVVVFLAYPLLLTFTRPLQLLSTTAIVFVFVVLWFVTWAAFEVAWEWNAGRLFGE